jgi:hypothetical protein
VGVLCRQDVASFLMSKKQREVAQSKAAAAVVKLDCYYYMRNAHEEMTVPEAKHFFVLLDGSNVAGEPLELFVLYCPNINLATFMWPQVGA